MTRRRYYIPILAGIVFFLHACSQPNINISVQDFAKGISRHNIQLLDVRTQNEYNSGHLKNAFLADWTDRQAFGERTQYLDKNKPVYTYCLSGGRSQAAAQWLQQQGFKEVHNLDGGIIAWKNENEPVEGVQQVPQMTANQFTKTLPTNKTVLVDVGAEWCPPCKKMESIVKDLREGHGNAFQLVTVNGGEQEVLARELNADSFPTFIVYKNGKEVWRTQGVTTKEDLLSHIQ
ncbi:MAG: rhodanese-like domain-containing protein [Flavisolibacter sp.]